MLQKLYSRNLLEAIFQLHTQNVSFVNVTVFKLRYEMNTLSTLEQDYNQKISSWLVRNKPYECVVCAWK